MTEYPLAAILLYLALVLAPADSNLVTIDGPEDAAHVGSVHLELRRTIFGWEVVRDGATQRISANNGSLFIHSPFASYGSTNVRTYVAPLKDHDWKTSPHVTLSPESTSLEKTDAGYVLHLDRREPSARAYTITHHRPPPVLPEAMITVQVTGAVMNPGEFKLAPGASLLDAIMLAGGIRTAALPERTRLTRGPTGQKTTTIHDVIAMHRGKLAAPLLEDDDRIWVSPIID